MKSERASFIHQSKWSKCLMITVVYLNYIGNLRKECTIILMHNFNLYINKNVQIKQISSEKHFTVDVRCDVGYLWVFWQGQVGLEFDEHKLEALLSAIPEDVPSQVLCPWFRAVFVPFVRRVLPTGQVRYILSSMKRCPLRHMLLRFQ